jgi:hypothetical protein
VSGWKMRHREFCHWRRGEADLKTVSVWGEAGVKNISVNPRIFSSQGYLLP